MVNSYKEAKAYIESFIRPTVFARIQADQHLTDPLQRMRYLLELLGNPQEKYPAIQVSGTSGKGSTAYLISHILKTSGYKVGFTLSPHLEKINERMQVNNVSIPDKEFVALVNELAPSVEKMSGEWIGKPSYFELVLTLALLYFAKQSVDILVAEVGLEGKYDGTNALHPFLAVLTNISLDHTRILGDTVEKIADEATSIIKEKNMMVVTGVEQDSVKKLVSEKAEKVDAHVIAVSEDQVTQERLRREGSVFTYQSSQGNIKDISLSLIGSYQHLNAALAIEAAFVLQKRGYSISEETIRKAFSTANFPGRFEIVQTNPLIILDGAHNPVKMAAFLKDLAFLYPTEKKVFLLAFKEGKDVEEMLHLVIPSAHAFVTTEFIFSTDMKRHAAYPRREINVFLERHKKPTQLLQSFSSAEFAFKNAQNIAKDLGGIVIVTGSLYLVGEIRSVLSDYL